MKTSLSLVGILASVLLMPFCVSAASLLNVAPIEISAGDSGELTISLENDKEITLVQFDLKLPAGLSIPVNNRDRYMASFTDRTTLEDHSLNVSAVEGGYRFLLASMTNTVIEGCSGPLIKVSLAADASFAGGTITIDHIILVSPDETAVSPDAVSVDVISPMSVSEPKAQSTGLVQTVYNLRGHKVANRARQRGVYIIDGRIVSYK